MQPACAACMRWSTVCSCSWQRWQLGRPGLQSQTSTNRASQRRVQRHLHPDVQGRCLHCAFLELCSQQTLAARCIANQRQQLLQCRIGWLLSHAGCTAGLRRSLLPSGIAAFGASSWAAGLASRTASFIHILYSKGYQLLLFWCAVELSSNPLTGCYNLCCFVHNCAA